MRELWVGTILSAVSGQHAYEGADLNCSAGRNGAKLTTFIKEW